MVSVGSHLVSDHNEMLDTMVVQTQRFRVLSLERTRRDGLKVSIANKQERLYAENHFEDQDNGEWVRDSSKADLFTYDEDWAIPHWLAPGSVVVSMCKQRRVCSCVAVCLNIRYHFISLLTLTFLLVSVRSYLFPSI